MQSAREYLTEAKIYELAEAELLRKWGIEHDRLEKMPDNKMCIERTQIAWDRMETLKEMAREKGLTDFFGDSGL